MSDRFGLAYRGRQMSPLAKSLRRLRCKGCGASVLWVERPNGWHVKLDARPVTGGRWMVDEHGFAHELNDRHVHQGTHTKHICEVKP